MDPRRAIGQSEGKNSSAIYKKPNYSFHRTELEFSGLEVMDLYHGDDLTEISTPLIKNITDRDLRLSGTKDYFNAMESLHKQILAVFD